MSRKDRYKNRNELLTKLDVLRDEVRVAYNERDKSAKKLEQVQKDKDALDAELQKTSAKLDKSQAWYCLVGVVVTILAVLVVSWFHSTLFSSKKFTPASNALEDGYVSNASEYYDGKFVFDVVGYMKQNGYKVTNNSGSDNDDRASYYMWFYNKKTKTSIDLDCKVVWPPSGDRDADDTPCLISKITIYRGEYGYQAGVKYTAIWTTAFSENMLSEIIVDDDSWLFLHKEALEALDKVLKSGNLEDESKCPFKGLGVEHSTVVDSVSASHDD